MNFKLTGRRVIAPGCKPRRHSFGGRVRTQVTGWARYARHGRFRPNAPTRWKWQQLG
jgi:hypothetical protein